MSLSSGKDYQSSTNEDDRRKMESNERLLTTPHSNERDQPNGSQHGSDEEELRVGEGVKRGALNDVSTCQSVDLTIADELNEEVTFKST